MAMPSHERCPALPRSPGVQEPGQVLRADLQGQVKLGEADDDVRRLGQRLGRHGPAPRRRLARGGQNPPTTVGCPQWTDQSADLRCPVGEKLARQRLPNGSGTSALYPQECENAVSGFANT
jgi:hypothetical protein